MTPRVSISQPRANYTQDIPYRTSRQVPEPISTQTRQEPDPNDPGDDQDMPRDDHRRPRDHRRDQGLFGVLLFQNWKFTSKRNHIPTRLKPVVLPLLLHSWKDQHSHII